MNKKQTLYSSIIIGLSLLLNSCAGTPTVSVRHLILDTPDKEFRYKTMNSVYMQIKKSNRMYTTDFSDFSTKDMFSIVNPQDLAKGVDRALSRFDGGVSVYRVVDNFKGNDPYLGKLNPTAVLNISIHSPVIKFNEKVEKRVSYSGEDQGKEYTVTIKTYSCRISGRAIFYSYPDMKEIANEKFSTSAKKVMEKSDQYKDSKNFFHQLSRTMSSFGPNSSDRMADVVESAYRKLPWAIVNSINTSTIRVRNRRYYYDRENKDENDSYTVIRDGDYDRVEKFWLNRVETSPTNWKNHWNLAVISEKRGDIEQAKERYQSVQAMIPENEKKVLGKFDEIFMDLKQSYQKRLNPLLNSNSWFQTKVAVLPLSDEVVSLDGADNVRYYLYQILKDGGYNVIPIEEVDEILRQNGFTDAGQFGATTKKQLAQWLKADWLVMGHITKYDGVNLGAYQSRNVDGEVFIWNAKTKKKILEADKKIRNRHFTDDDQNPLLYFLKGVGVSILERMVDAHLATEAAELARRSLEGLPYKP